MLVSGSGEGRGGRIVQSRSSSASSSGGGVCIGGSGGGGGGGGVLGWPAVAEDGPSAIASADKLPRPAVLNSQGLRRCNGRKTA